MKKDVKLESYKDNIFNGLFVGMILLISSLLVIRCSENVILWEQTMRYIFLGIVFYLLVGVIVVQVYRRERKLPDKPKNHYHNAGGLYTSSLFFIAFTVSNIILPRMAGVILWTNLFVLFILWLMEYIYLKKLAKKLNMGINLVKETLIIELEEKPKGAEAVYSFLDSYCKKNKILMETKEIEIPGKVYLDGMEYTVSISTDYTMFGTCAYAIVLTSVVER